MRRYQITEIYLKEQEHPYLFLNAEELAKIQDLVKDERTYQHQYVMRLRAGAEQWLQNKVPIPDTGSGGDGGFCPVDGAWLIHDLYRPHAHECPKCGKVYTGEEYDALWRTKTHQRIALLVRDLGLLWGLFADIRYAQEAAWILLWYADRYMNYPVVNLSKLGGWGGTPTDVAWVIGLAQETCG